MIGFLILCLLVPCQCATRDVDPDDCNNTRVERDAEFVRKLEAETNDTRRVERDVSNLEREVDSEVNETRRVERDTAELMREFEDETNSTGRVARDVENWGREAGAETRRVERDTELLRELETESNGTRVERDVSDWVRETEGENGTLERVERDTDGWARELSEDNETRRVERDTAELLREFESESNETLRITRDVHGWTLTCDEWANGTLACMREFRTNYMTMLTPHLSDHPDLPLVCSRWWNFTACAEMFDVAARNDLVVPTEDCDMGTVEAFKFLMDVSEFLCGDGYDIMVESIDCLSRNMRNARSLVTVCSSKIAETDDDNDLEEREFEGGFDRHEDSKDDHDCDDSMARKMASCFMDTMVEICPMTEPIADRFREAFIDNDLFYCKLRTLYFS